MVLDFDATQPSLLLHHRCVSVNTQTQKFTNIQQVFVVDLQLQSRVHGRALQEHLELDWIPFT